MSVEAADPAGPDPVVLVIPAPVTLADVPPLCAQLQALYGQGVEEVVCDLAELTRATLASVEAVARLRLTARRAGRRVRMRHTSPDLMALLTLMGLDCLAHQGDDTPPSDPSPPVDLAWSSTGAPCEGPAPPRQARPAELDPPPPAQSRPGNSTHPGAIPGG